MEGSFGWSRDQSLGEEIANSISHGIGALAAVVITPLLIIKAIPLGAAPIIGVSIFGGKSETSYQTKMKNRSMLMKSPKTPATSRKYSAKNSLTR